MGNKASSSLDYNGDQEGEGQVKLRSKDKKKKKKSRPTSEPIMTYDQNISFSPRPTSDMLNSTMNPIADPSSPSFEDTTSRLAKQRSLDIYWDSLGEILREWNEYAPLKDLHIEAMDVTIIEALRRVFNRLSDQKLTNRDLRWGNEDLERVVETQRRELCDQEEEIEALKEDIQLLKGDLKRRGIEPKLPERNRKTVPSPTFPRGHSRHPSNMSSGSEIEIKSNALKYQKRASFQATPLLVAEGQQGYSSALRRSSSLKPVSPPDNIRRYKSVDAGQASYDNTLLSPESPARLSESRAMEELMQKVSHLELCLERERKDKQLLIKRFDLNESDKSEPMSPMKKTWQLERLNECTKYAERFYQLQNSALNSVTKTLICQNKKIPTKTISRFICTTFMESYRIAFDLVHKFQLALDELLKNPIQLNEKLKEKRKSRSSVTMSIPPDALADLQSHISKVLVNSDNNLLGQHVIESLKKDFRSCCSPAIVNNSIYSKFLDECCRLSWQMVLLLPPMHVDDQCDENRQINERYQEALNYSISNNAIDYVAWPALFKNRHGDVICKAKVIGIIEERM